MKTYSFIGSDKNSGKTTAFNYVYRQLCKEQQGPAVCLSSIGINGEDVDSFEGGIKPSIKVMPHSYFITHAPHLACHTGRYETLLALGRPYFSKTYMFGRSLLEMQLVLEGPNRGYEISNAKQQISSFLGGEGVFLIDGSIDRQFLAKPEISDGFYFSVLFTKDAQQYQRSCNFLKTISLAPCGKKTRRLITKNLRPGTQSLLFADSGQLIYRGVAIVSRDRELRSRIESGHHAPGILYLKGGLTRSLWAFLAPFEGLQMILDNFTLFLNINGSQQKDRGFKPEILLYHQVPVRNIFIKQSTHFNHSLLPSGLAARNLFREIHHEG